MPNYAVVEDGIVVNTVVADADYAASQGWLPMSDAVEIGWSYIDGEFIDERPKPEPAPEPQPVTKEELLAQLQALQAQITALGE